MQRPYRGVILRVRDGNTKTSMAPSILTLSALGAPFSKYALSRSQGSRFLSEAYLFRKVLFSSANMIALLLNRLPA
jgi:hypothetical protein